MTLLTPALIMTGIAVTLLAVYGADVIIGYTSEEGDGFIPFDHAVRGMALGLPALILPIIAYLISRKEPSKGLGIMIIVAGVLILVGGGVVIGNADMTVCDDTPTAQVDCERGDVLGEPVVCDDTPTAQEDCVERNILAETAPLIIAGLIQIGLGILKIKKS